MASGEGRSRAGGDALLWGAAVTLAVLGLLTLVMIPYALAILAQALVRLTPGGIATAAIERLGHLALPAFGFGVSVAFVLVSWFAGGRIGRRAVEVGATAWVLVPWWIAWTAAYWLLRLPNALTFTAATALAPALGTAAAVHAAKYLASMRDAALAAATASAETDVPGADTDLIQRPKERPNTAASQSRRMLLRSGLVGVAGVAVAAGNLGPRLGGGQPSTRAITPTTPAPIPSPVAGDAGFAQVEGLSPFYTPINTFYTVDEALFDPMVDLSTWRLEITGMVDHPQSYTFDQLLDMESLEQVRMLACISNRVGGDLAGNTRWTGVVLPELLDRAGVQSGAVEVVFRSVDGFSSSHPIAHAQDPDALVAYAMDGAELPTRHGYPARILMPGTYGMKNPKWLTEIQLVGTPELGYWESRGWSNTAVILTSSRIDTPRGTVKAGQPTTIGGVAWAGDRSISRVEVSTDGGATWEDAVLETPVSHLAWVRWLLPWTPEQLGDAMLVVRATDGEGMAQAETETDAHPSGASGWHHLGVRVA